MQNMRRILCYYFALLPCSLFAQDNYEIQVYGSQTQAKNSSIFELHSNYTFVGEKSIVKGIRPSYHSLHETIEITTGITGNFELGFYLFMNYTDGYGYKIIGSHIRPRIMAPQAWNLPVGLSLSLEFGVQSLQYSTEHWNLEIRPIIDKQLGKLYLSFNPTMGIALEGIDNDSRPVFEPNFKAAYNFSKKTSLGFEYYGSLGAINQFEKPADQSHALFFAYDLAGNKDWELNIGPGWGLSKATDGFVFKILVGRRIQWHAKHT
jgi:hypothetical protein